MPSKRAESVFPHETAEMQANLLLRREDIFSHVPCTREFYEIPKRDARADFQHQTAVVDALIRLFGRGSAKLEENEGVSLPALCHRCAASPA
jgi:hypothetical protein